jgi:uncharacterized protein YlxP (DUF503 family)
MVVGILQFELLIHGAESIKDKRRVVSSVKDRLHREHQVSVAEVGLQDTMSAARLALALVGSDGRHVGQTLDRITAKLRGLHGAELGDLSREVLHDPRGEDARDQPPQGPGAGADGELAAELLERGEDALREEHR